MVEPPLEAALHDTSMEPAPAVIAMLVGAEGTVRGATDVDHTDATPIPTLFTALTLKVYDAPFVNEEIDADVAAEVPLINEYQVLPPFKEYSIS